MKKLFLELREKYKNTTLGRKVYHKPISAAGIIYTVIALILVTVIVMILDLYDKTLAFLFNDDNFLNDDYFFDFDYFWRRILFGIILSIPLWILYAIAMNYIFKFYDFLKLKISER